MRHIFTDKELKVVKKNLTVLVDSREQNNQHIIDFFESKKIPYKVSKNDYGDYSCFIPANTIEGQTRSIYFDRDIAIERKNSIDELAGNFKDDGVRLKTELAHMNLYGIRTFLFVEDPEFDKNIRTGNYRSKYSPKSLYFRIKKSLEIRYNTPLRPVAKEYIGSEIYNTLEAFVYEKLKHEGIII